jgi:hypothetical protein
VGKFGESLDLQRRAGLKMIGTMKNYRVSFDYAAESPTKAIIYLIGIIEDPEAWERPLEWLVTDLDSGKQHKITRSLAHLAAEAKADLQKFLDESNSEKG